MKQSSIFKTLLSFFVLLCLSNAGITAKKEDAADGDTKKKAGQEKKMKPFADNNKDGKITKEDFPAKMVKKFNEFDLNGDGMIDPSEKDTYMREMKQKKAEGFVKKMEEAFQDKNGDGKVTKDEVDEKMQKVFAKLDRDKNGQIDKAEKDDYIRKQNEKMLNGAKSKVPKDDDKKKKKKKKKEE